MPDYLLYRMDGLPPYVGDESLLDSGEREAYAKRGLPYLQERCLLKREIARRLGITAAEVHLTIGEQGKPSFPGIHFNLSHSGDWLCIAFHHLPVGVDIERIRPRKNLEGLARRIMGEQQLQQFREHGCPVDEFYACWCAAEALVKHAGCGIGCAKRFPFLYRKGKIEPMEAGMPTVELFSPAEGYQGAVAYSVSSVQKSLIPE